MGACEGHAGEGEPGSRSTTVPPACGSFGSLESMEK